MSDRNTKTSSTDSALDYYLNKDQSPNNKARPSTPKGKERQTTKSAAPPSSNSRPVTPVGGSTSRRAENVTPPSRKSTPSTGQKQSPLRAGGPTSSAKGSPPRSSVASAAASQDNTNRASDNSFNSLEQEIWVTDKGYNAQNTRTENANKKQAEKEEEKKFASGNIALMAGQTSLERRETANRRLRMQAEQEAEDAKREERKAKEAEAERNKQARVKDLSDLSIRSGQTSHDRKYKDGKGKGKDTKKPE